MLQSSSLSLRESQGVSNIDFQIEAKTSELLTPFERIKRMAEDTELMKRLLDVTNIKFQTNVEADFLLSSCIVNFFLLNMCFIGEERALEMKKPLLLSLSTRIDISMYESGKLVKSPVLFHNIIGGGEVLEQNKKFQDPAYRYSEEDIIHSIANLPNFSNSFEPFKRKVEQLYLTKKFDHSIFEYNHPIIEALESEMNENRNNVSENCSFIYHLNIDCPDLEIVQKGTQDQVEIAPQYFIHAFILEQYYCPKDNIDKVRLHQSYLGKLTLAEYYAKMSNSNKGIFDAEKLKNFFYNLKGLLSSGKNPKFNSQRESNFICFGVQQEPLKLGKFFRPGDGIFTGLCFRYMTSKIDPNECNRHMDELIKKYG